MLIFTYFKRIIVKLICIQEIMYQNIIVSLKYHLYYFYIANQCYLSNKLIDIYVYMYKQMNAMYL